MSASVAIGLLLATATALASIVGFLYKHRGAIAGGLVLLTAVADRFFAHQVTRREWIGVTLAALGLAFLAATLEGSADSAPSDYDSATLAVFVAIVAAVGVAVAIGGRSERGAGVLFGASARLLWAASDLDQGAQRRPPRGELGCDGLRPASGGDRDRILRRAADLGPQPSSSARRCRWRLKPSSLSGWFSAAELQLALLDRLLLRDRIVPVLLLRLLDALLQLR